MRYKFTAPIRENPRCEYVFYKKIGEPIGGGTELTRKIATLTEEFRKTENELGSAWEVIRVEELSEDQP